MILFIRLAIPFSPINLSTTMDPMLQYEFDLAQSVALQLQAQMGNLARISPLFYNSETTSVADVWIAPVTPGLNGLTMAPETDNEGNQVFFKCKVNFDKATAHASVSCSATSGRMLVFIDGMTFYSTMEHKVIGSIDEYTSLRLPASIAAFCTKLVAEWRGVCYARLLYGGAPLNQYNRRTDLFIEALVLPAPQISLQRKSVTTTTSYTPSVKINDCGTCKYCQDKPRYGGRNTLRKKCIYKPQSGDSQSHKKRKLDADDLFLEGPVELQALFPSDPADQEVPTTPIHQFIT